jgi:hypothetical protein
MPIVRQDGGGVYAGSQTTLHMESTVFDANAAGSGNGLAFYADPADASVTDCTFRNHQARGTTIYSAGSIRWRCAGRHRTGTPAPR